jgi:anhydro-N-acetylmuramic acid kinase
MIILGLMSGTSLDGLDMAACKFWVENKQWKYEIIKAETYQYNFQEKEILKNAINLSGAELISLHHQYGNLIGQKVNEFCQQHHIKPDYIASHGHTIFHQPNNQSNFFTNQENPSSTNQNSKSPIQNSQFTIQNSKSPIQNSQFTIQNSKSPIQNPQHPIHNSQFTIHNSKSLIHNSTFTIHNSKSPIHNSQFTGFTFQLGHGADISAQTGIKTICDFRTTDVAYGGQGAPLVPIGDELLFSAFDYCLNLGGISNISFNENGIRKAFDIGICNIALNHLVQEINLKYDKDGLIAQSGKTNESLLNQLINAAKINHLNQHSLGFEWYKNFMEPLLRLSEASIPDKLSTVCEFIALQIAHTINTNGKILITGGGAKNKFLIECIKHKVNNQIVIPDEQLTDFKEALIFAFLGMLRVNESVNALCQVTGASKDTSGGCIYLP